MVHIHTHTHTHTQTRANMPCDTCNKEGIGLGVYAGINLTLVCAACASTVVSDDDESLLCFSKARDMFPEIPPKRLKELGSTPRRNPHYRNAAPMRLLSLAEIRVLWRKVAQEQIDRASVQENKRQDRLARMVRVHKISPVSPIHRSLFEHIFGDYLRANNPKKTLRELKYRFSAHDVSVRLCPRDPVCAMNFLENRGITDFSFSMEIRERFDYSLFLSARVFRLEALSIARFICPAQLTRLRGGPLAQIPAAVARLKKNAPHMLRVSLRCLDFDSTQINLMMSCRAMKTRIRRCIDFAHDPDTVARKMKEFWVSKNDAGYRRQILQTAMRNKGLEIRRDSAYCHDFIHGDIDVDLEEIVGIQFITRELFDDGGPRHWSENHAACESSFRTALVENGLDMEKAISISLKCASRVCEYW